MRLRAGPAAWARGPFPEKTVFQNGRYGRRQHLCFDHCRAEQDPSVRQLAMSVVVLAQPAVSFAAVADTDGDGLDDNCDACPGTPGAGPYGCP